MIAASTLGLTLIILDSLLIIAAAAFFMAKTRVAGLLLPSKTTTDVARVSTVYCSVCYSVSFLLIALLGIWDTWSTEKITFAPAVLTVVAFGIWQFVAGTELWKNRRDNDELRKQLLENYEQRQWLRYSVDAYKTVLVVLRRSVNAKTRRIRSEFEKVSEKRRDINHIRSAFVPNTMISEKLKAVAQCLREATTTADHRNSDLRLNLFRENKERATMELIYSWNDPAGGDEASRCYKSFPEYFAIDQERKLKHTAIVVECTDPVSGRIIVVPDCEKDDKDPNKGFFYFQKEQAAYLRSMLACPLEDFLSGEDIRAGITIDTNVTGFFCDAWAEWYQNLINTFAATFRLEFAVRDLIDEQIEVPHDLPNQPR